MRSARPVGGIVIVFIGADVDVSAAAAAAAAAADAVAAADVLLVACACCNKTWWVSGCWPAGGRGVRCRRSVELAVAAASTARAVYTKGFT